MIIPRLSDRDKLLRLGAPSKDNHLIESCEIFEYKGIKFVLTSRCSQPVVDLADNATICAAKSILVHAAQSCIDKTGKINPLQSETRCLSQQEQPIVCYFTITA